MKIIEINCQQETDCSLAVGMWNYLDHEHVTEVHEGFVESQVIYESGDIVMAVNKMKAPILSFFKVNNVGMTVKKDENTLLCFSTMPGMTVKTTINITETQKDHTVYKMKYEFMLIGWKEFFAPLIKIYLNKKVPIWNERQWQEDLPLKSRRQKVLKMGFKDFHGLPAKISDRYYDGPFECKIPVPRLPGSPVDRLVASLKK